MTSLKRKQNQTCTAVQLLAHTQVCNMSFCWSDVRSETLHYISYVYRPMFGCVFLHLYHLGHHPIGRRYNICKWRQMNLVFFQTLNFFLSKDNGNTYIIFVRYFLLSRISYNFPLTSTGYIYLLFTAQFFQYTIQCICGERR